MLARGVSLTFVAIKIVEDVDRMAFPLANAKNDGMVCEF